MNYSQVINEIENLVEMTCKKESNYFGYGIWTHHILNVRKFSLLMADKINADKEVVEVAALLHDYASVLDFKYYAEHEEYGAKFARELLQKYGFDNEFIIKVSISILNHRGSVPRIKMTAEEKCLADGDAMSHFLSIGSLFYLCFNSHKLDIDQSEKWIYEKLERSWNKLSREAKSIVKPYYKSAQLLLKK